ncbi:acyloxyacyl hydrolase [Parabacteroides pacaensis]|uniref:acyloxyacyl hydrolase n=1 Tax=Parabacteroides pacaensis TaxID=2086575 RepID=UPI000D104916|nr:acyloxyacyl hydrolase [Parabacteroides pacaensis]
MQRTLLLLFITLANHFALQASLPVDTAAVKKKKPQFITANATGGWVFPTNDFVSGKNKIPFYSSFALKYGISSEGDDWEDLIYGMPYYGFGIYTANFLHKKDLGHPLSIYLFQGSTIKRFNPSLALNYEWNLGMSFNWKPYDPFDNPENIALGSSTNVHVALSSYLKWTLDRYWDLHVGVGFTHFSNGASKLPNKGLNLVAPFIEVSYNFNCEPVDRSAKAKIKVPKLDPRIDYDILFVATSRQAKFDTTGTNLASPYIDKNFKVFSLSYATMFVKSHKYKWGPSVEVVYDESSGAKAWRELNPADGNEYDRIKLGSPGERFSVGLSLKGEMVMPRISLFAQLGYNLLHGNKNDYRLYQILGAKLYVTDNIFGAFGIRAARFGKAQYLYWSIGYTLEGRPFHKKEKFIHRLLPD